MKKRFYLITYAWLLFAPAKSWSQVEGFEESFSGQGDYQSVGTVYEGLDNPGWSVYGNGEITEAGYAFNLEGTESPMNTVQETIIRQVYGQGSFLHEIVLKDLALGDGGENAFNAGTTISLRHVLATGEPNRRFGISLFDPQEPGVWQLQLSTGIDGARQTVMVPKAAEYSRIALRYDHDTSLIAGYYDFDMLDELPPVELEVPLVSDLTSESETRLDISAALLDTSGVLHSWSLTPFSNMTGDFSGNGALDVTDIDELSVQVRGATNDARFDLNGNSLVDNADLAVWVHDLKKTYFGDADLDGQFNSQDLTLVFQAGRYEDAIQGNSGWASGDWNADAEFTSSDLVIAFQDGGYEKGLRPAVSAVPESNGLVLLVMGVCGLLRLRAAR